MDHEQPAVMVIVISMLWGYSYVFWLGIAGYFLFALLKSTGRIPVWKISIHRYRQNRMYLTIKQIEL
jgi:hypothetical protein